MTRLRPVGVALAVSLIGVACGGPGFPATTQASDARTDDPWLEGEPCAPVGQTDGGLRVEDLAAGEGRPIERGDTVRVHYSARTALAGGGAGAPLHDTRAAGPPVEIAIGSTRMICGVELALVGMRAGGKRRVAIPWRLAFGEAGRAPDVRPRTDLEIVLEPFWPADPETGRGGSLNRPPPAGRRR